MKDQSELSLTNMKKTLKSATKIGSIAILLAVFGAAGSCKHRTSGTSDLDGTGPQELKSSRKARLSILSDLEDVAYPIFHKIVDRYKSGKITNRNAKKMSRRLLTMFENMTVHSPNPIHPIAFYAAIKDFELGESKRWSPPAGNNIQYYEFSGLKKYRRNNALRKKVGINTTKNCTSGQCVGNFQVDVIETSGTRKKINNKTGLYFRKWNGWKADELCGSKVGLGISNMKGGMDFCTALYWWNLGGDGFKCKILWAKKTKNRKSKVNPCDEIGRPWTYKLISYGRLVYGQAVQSGWKRRGRSWVWGKQYLFYENLILSNRFEKKIVGLDGASIVTAIDKLIDREGKTSAERQKKQLFVACEFRKSIGLAGMREFPGKKCNGVAGSLNPRQVDVAVVDSVVEAEEANSRVEALDRPYSDEDAFRSFQCEAYQVKSGDSLTKISNHLLGQVFPEGPYKLGSRRGEVRTRISRNIRGHIQKINGMSANDTNIKSGELLILPIAHHSVNGGETLTSIARRYYLEKESEIESFPAQETPWSWLMKSNGFTSSNISIGDSFNFYSFKYCMEKRPDFASN